MYSMVMAVVLIVMFKRSLSVLDQRMKFRNVSLICNHRLSICTVSGQMVKMKVFIIFSLNHHLACTKSLTSLTLLKLMTQELKSYTLGNKMAVFKFNSRTIKLFKMKILLFNGNLKNR